MTNEQIVAELRRLREKVEQIESPSATDGSTMLATVTSASNPNFSPRQWHVVTKAYVSPFPGRNSMPAHVNVQGMGGFSLTEAIAGNVGEKRPQVGDVVLCHNVYGAWLFSTSSPVWPNF